MKSYKKLLNRKTERLKIADISKINQKKGISLQILLIAPFVLQIFGVVALVGYFSFRNGQKSVQNLAEQLMVEIEVLISEHLDTYLATPHTVNQLNKHALDLGHLNPQDLRSMEQHFWRQSQVFDLVSYIQFGNAQGEFVGLEVNDDRTVRYQVTEFQKSLQTYNIDEQGNRGEFLKTSPNYDPRNRPWYIVPQQADRPAWTDIYAWVNPPTLAITLGQPYYDSSGNFQGILATDLTIAQISDFLRTLKIGKSGQTFIFDASGWLIATSANELPFTMIEDIPQRIHTKDSSDLLTRSTVEYLIAHFGSLKNINEEQNLHFTINGEKHFLNISFLQDEHRLNWIGAIVVPESDFMSEVHANNRISILLCFGALGLATTLGICTSRWITRPILQLIDASQAISTGYFNQVLGVKGIRELDALTFSFNQMAEQLKISFRDLERANQNLEQEIVERQQIGQELEYNALHDPLTDLPNRSLLMERLEQVIKRIRREENYLCAVLFIDLDRFKIINDSLGHQIGDLLLIAIAQKLTSIVRETDTIARLGGDEFIALLEPIKQINDAIDIAERIIEELRLPFYLEERQVFTAASIGIVLSSKEYSQADDLLRDADIAMYRAKSQGKSRYEMFDQGMYNLALARHKLENELCHALDRQEFQVYYQPIISLENKQIVGFEALLRWQHPERGLISPAKYVPIAEEIGLIVPIGEWILHSACQQMALWQTQISTASQLKMSVNLSVKQLQDPNLLEIVKKVLAQTGLEGKSLQLELTESMLMENLEVLTSLLWQLKAEGIELSIDDFGTGYSSLSYLHRLPIDNLKIDRSFISSIGKEKDDRNIVATIINLAHQMEMTTIAEGIESQEQLHSLQFLGCEKVQGYLFSRPVPLDQATALLLKKQ